MPRNLDQLLELDKHDHPTIEEALLLIEEIKRLRAFKCETDDSVLLVAKTVHGALVARLESAIAATQRLNAMPLDASECLTIISQPFAVPKADHDASS